MGFDSALDSLKKQEPKDIYLDSLNRAILLNPDLTFEEKQAMTKPIRARMISLEDSLALFLRLCLVDRILKGLRLAAEA